MRGDEANHVQWVVGQRLCTCCGACAGVCPASAIEMRIDAFGVFTPVVDEDACTRCGLCFRVCPGRSFDYRHFQEKIHGRLPGSAAAGAVLETWAGITTDEEILAQSQSGGFVSTLLVHCLEKGTIDGAVASRWREDDPFRPETYIARTRRDVLAAVGSKYNPLPAAAIIRQLRAESGRFIFVGTPCQIHGMRKAEEIEPDLGGRIVLYIGLHCLKVFNYHYHDQILHKLGLRREEVSYFRYRDKAWRGWPCDMRLIDAGGGEHHLAGPYSRLWARSFFSHWRCHLCFDKLNEFSDVSCGDCRIGSSYGLRNAKEAYYRKPGKSDIVVRTRRAREMLRDLAADKRMVLAPTSTGDLVRSTAVAEKKLGVGAFASAARLVGKEAPEYGVEFILPRGKARVVFNLMKPVSALFSIRFYAAAALVRRRLFRRIMKTTPHRLMWLFEHACGLLVNHVRFRRAPDLVAVHRPAAARDRRPRRRKAT